MNIIHTLAHILLIRDAQRIIHNNHTHIWTGLDRAAAANNIIIFYYAGTTSAGGCRRHRRQTVFGADKRDRKHIAEITIIFSEVTAARWRRQKIVCRITKHRANILHFVRVFLYYIQLLLLLFVIYGGVGDIIDVALSRFTKERGVHKTPITNAYDSPIHGAPDAAIFRFPVYARNIVL